MTLAEFEETYPACVVERRKSGGVYVIPRYEYEGCNWDLFHLSDYAVSSSCSGPGLNLVPRTASGPDWIRKRQ